MGWGNWIPGRRLPTALDAYKHAHACKSWHGCCLLNSGGIAVCWLQQLVRLLRPESCAQGVVKRFFNEKEVTSTLVMDALVSGVKQIEECSRLGESKKVSCLS